MFRPPASVHPDAHLGPVHGPDPESPTARVNREIAELIAAHQYGWGGPCGGCDCGWIDDDPGHDEGFEDHVVAVLVAHFDLRWRRSR